MIHATDGLRRELDDLVKDRQDMLDTLDLGTPDGVEPGVWRRAVLDLLADLRLDGVEIELSPHPGPPWILDARFTEGWSP